MRSFLVGITLLAVGLLLGGSGTYFLLKTTDWRQGKLGISSPAKDDDREDTPTATCVTSEEKVAALARLEPVNGVISMSGTPGDRLETLEVKLGDYVKAGSLLATFESHTLRDAELQVAKSQLEEAEKRKTSEEHYAEAMLAEADLAEGQAALHERDRQAQNEKLLGLEAAASSAQRDLGRLTRVRGLPDDAIGADIVSDQQLEHQKVACDKAEREVAAAQADLDKLDEAVRLAHEEARAKRKTAEANRARVDTMVQIDSLKKQVSLAQRRLDLTELRAPSDGEILKTFLNPGDTLAQKPVLQMADTSRVVAIAEVYEDDAARVKPRAAACVGSRALPAPLLGSVEVIGQMVAKNTVVGLNPTDSTDIRVVEARIVLDRVADGAQAEAIDAGGKLTPGKEYRYQIVYAGGRHRGESLPSTPIGAITLAHGENAIRLASIPKLEKSYTMRRIYRTKAGENEFHLLCEQRGGDALTTEYIDKAADADLGDPSSLRPLVNLQVNAVIDAAPE